MPDRDTTSNSLLTRGESKEESTATLRARIDELSAGSNQEELLIALDGLFMRIWRSYPDEAESIAWRVVNTASRLQHTSYLARGYRLLGLHYYARSRYAEAMDYYLKASEIFQNQGDDLEYAKILNNIGLIYMDQGLLNIALESFKHSLGIKIEHGAHLSAAHTYLNLGLIHKKLGDHNRSLQSFWEALAVWQEAGDEHNIACCYTDIGTLQRIMGFPKKAMKLHQSALAIRARTGDLKGQAISIGNIAGILTIDGDHEGALSHYHQCLSLQEQIRDNANIAKTYLYIGELHTCMEEYVNAQKNLDTALRMSRDLHIPNLEAECNMALSTLKERMGDPQSALDFYREYIRLRETIQEKQLSTKTEEFQKMIQKNMQLPPSGNSEDSEHGADQ